MVERRVETYRGCDIYHYDAGDITPGAVYGTPCVTGYWNTLAGCRSAIDRKLGAVTPPPPPPPEEEDRLVETYRDVEIWWIASVSMYRAQVAAGYVAVGYTLEEVRAGIDEILAFLNPPEEPPDGLFAQVTAAVKAWVLANLPDWVLEWGKVINNWITNTYETIQNVYNDFVTYVTNVYNNAYEYITNTYNYLTENISNVYNYLTENITNIYNNTSEYITNVTGVSQEILDNTLAGIISFINDRLLNYAPQGFQSNPEKFIQDHAEERYHSMLEEAIRSFWEGFEEGLKE